MFNIIVNKDKKQLSNNGFTIVEVMAAIMVLSVGLVGSLTVLTKNLGRIIGNEDRVIAANLAAEGLELSRNLRDTNWLKGEVDWKKDLEGVNPASETIKFFCGDLSHQQIPSSPSTLAACGENCRMYIYTKNITGSRCFSDNFSNQIGYNTTARVATNYYRLITLSQKNGGDAVEVKVDVKWGPGTQNIITATEILYNWK